ncbi:hypothetical protein DH2020_006799 [Rehmannia glutinosa]|uniref:Uncharacterized protein n=1 Tax=Rehmannia glutinosa TaxID=99300 RepID=A0ABR0XK53_REHGL
MSVLERQRSRLKWQQQQEQLIQPITYFNEENVQLGSVFSGLNGDQGLGELLMGGAMKPDPGIEPGWGDDIRRVLSYGNGSELEMGYAIPRTLSCPPNVAASIAQEAALSSAAAAGREGSKKRKADKTPNLKVVAEEKSEEKKIKGCGEDDSKITEQNSSSKSTTTTVTNNKNSKGPSANTKENSKTSDAPKPDYIHVRARRGCNKITGKAGMLDEIINYVQSLQRQFLSMKLAAINPRLDFDVDNYLAKESLEMAVNPMDVTLRRTISAPVTIPQTFLDSSSLNQIQQLTWEDELQNLYGMEYQQGRSTSFISQPFTGFLEAGHVKLEM